MLVNHDDAHDAILGSTNVVTHEPEALSLDKASYDFLRGSSILSGR